MKVMLWCVVCIIGVISQQPLQCGVATNTFTGCPDCMATAIGTGHLDFWWNWDTHPKIDLTVLSPSVQHALQQSFVPMIWGDGIPVDGWGFLSQGTYVMGFNEPDQYGPACVGSWNPPAYGCSPGEYRDASSSGWADLFDPSVGSPDKPRAAKHWQIILDNMTYYRKPQGITKIVSPSMAQGADIVHSCIGVDPSKAGAPKYCPGWMQVFKQNTLTLQCTDLTGATINCWDLNDHIQIHAYAKKASAVLSKIEEYYAKFTEDFEGTNGRKKKTLWLTEVAYGGNNVTEIQQFMTDLMNPQTGLTNRAKYGYVEKVSWFSEWAFDAFTLDNIPPKKNEAWSSTLFEPFGPLSPIGKTFFSFCAQGRQRGAP